MIHANGPTLTAHPEGYCLRFGAEVIAVFRTLAEAALALRAARDLSVALPGRPAAANG